MRVAWSGNSNISDLTASEERVYRLVGLGLSNDEIAEHLFISSLTVRTHMKRIYAKFGIQNKRGEGTARIRLSLESYKAYWASPNKFAGAIELLKMRGGKEMNAKAIEVLTLAGR